MNLRKAQHLLEYGALRAFALLTNLFPARCIYLAGRGLGLVLFDVIRIRRRVALQNLELAFGEEKSRDELVRIGRESYKNLAVSMLEFFRFRRLNKDRVTQTLDLSDLQKVRRLLDEGEGKGVVLVCPHMGNWELGGVGMCIDGLPVFYIVGAQHNPYVDRYMNDIRKSAGIEMVSISGALKGAFRAISRGKMLTLLADQYASRKGVFVDFFGKRASSPQGPAVFALRTGVPLVAGCTVRVAWNKHTSFIEDKLEFEETGEFQEDVKRLTAAYTKAFENYIRKNPEQYFWMHRRWKNSPDL